MVGTAEDLDAVLKLATEDEESLQTLITRLYIKESYRKKLRLQVDHKSSLFQNLYGVAGKFSYVIFS